MKSIHNILMICNLLILISHTSDRHLLISQSQPEPTRATVYGAWGQDCTPPFDDNPPNNCVETGQLIFSPTGKMECSENFDCCLCGSIKCGFSRNNDGKIIPCAEFHVNGDSGAFGVKNIDVIGSPVSGAVINCGGDHACEKTAIYGKNIAHIQCAGDHACAQSQWDLTCLKDLPCPVNCRGDNACTSGDEKTAFVVSNTAGLSCADDACKHGIFRLDSNIGGGSILCHGESACQGFSITVNNIAGIACGGVNACRNAQIHVIDPQQDFSLDCTAFGSCSGVDLEIYLSQDSNIDFFKGFNCNGASSCLALSVNIINYSKNYLTIENLECQAMEACKYAYFNIINGGFENCKCGTALQESCKNTQGIETCFTGLDKLECIGYQSCYDTTQTLLNIANGFQLICASKESCKNMNLGITINNIAENHVDYIKGYMCNDDNSCENSEITFINQQLYQREPIVFDKIECGGMNGCKGTLFKFQGDIEVKDVICGGDKSCSGCRIQHNDKFIPCSQF